MKSQDRKDYSSNCNSKYDRIGKSAAKKLIEAVYPDWTRIIKGEQFKGGDLFYDNGVEDEAEVVIEAEARTKKNWKEIFNRNPYYGVRIPNGKNPYAYPECKWDCYVQTGVGSEHQGVFFGPGALKDAKIEENVRYWNEDTKSWDYGTFAYPNPDDITFYQIIDGEVEIID